LASVSNTVSNIVSNAEEISRENTNIMLRNFKFYSRSGIR
jgi:hypothetical protein